MKAPLPHSNWAKLKKALWNIKVSVQYTGWLQYLPLLIASIAFFILSQVHLYISTRIFSLVSQVLMLLCYCAFATFMYDIIVVKYGFHFQEPIPNTDVNKYLNPFELMRKRRSCRSFSDHVLKREHLADLLEEVKVQTSTENLIGKVPIRFEYIAAPLTVWVYWNTCLYNS